VFDALNLPAVINENAVQTLLLNQDRYNCEPGSASHCS
jgi:hypothetical protein